MHVVGYSTTLAHVAHRIARGLKERRFTHPGTGHRQGWLSSGSPQGRVTVLTPIAARSRDPSFLLLDPQWSLLKPMYSASRTGSRQPSERCSSAESCHLRRSALDRQCSSPAFFSSVSQRRNQLSRRRHVPDFQPRPQPHLPHCQLVGASVRSDHIEALAPRLTTVTAVQISARIRNLDGLSR